MLHSVACANQCWKTWCHRAVPMILVESHGGPTHESEEFDETGMRAENGIKGRSQGGKQLLSVHVEDIITVRLQGLNGMAPREPRCCPYTSRVHEISASKVLAMTMKDALNVHFHRLPQTKQFYVVVSSLLDQEIDSLHVLDDQVYRSVDVKILRSGQGRLRILFVRVSVVERFSVSSQDCECEEKTVICHISSKALYLLLDECEAPCVMLEPEQLLRFRTPVKKLY